MIKERWYTQGAINGLARYVARKKKYRLLDRVSQGLEPHPTGGRRIRFLTLTLSDQVDDTQIMKFWGRLRAYLAKPRRAGKGRKISYRHYRYFWVKEFTKKGTRHLHVMVDAYIPWQLIKNGWYHATGRTSWVVHIAANDLHSPAGYLAKYMTKVMNGEYRKGERRFGFSRDPVFRSERSRQRRNGGLRMTR